MVSICNHVKNKKDKTDLDGFLFQTFADTQQKLSDLIRK